MCFRSLLGLCRAGDPGNIYDMCPTDTSHQMMFMNGYPCKDPRSVTASDFKTTLLNESGDTRNFYLSAVTMATASVFPGLNTLGLSAARTDIEVDGAVLPHSHPRASEMIFVSSGDLVAGFLDSNNQVFQIRLKKGDVFVFPKGLLHFCFNAGFDKATIFSVLNSQNPGLVSLSGAMFEKKGSGDRKMLLKNILTSVGVGDCELDF